MPRARPIRPDPPVRSEKSRFAGIRRAHCALAGWPARPVLLAVLAALAMVTSACATLPGSPRVKPLPVEARVQATKFIVVTVRNAPRPQAERAGSTPRGYDAVGAYGVTAAASETVHALERAYGLREVSAWPIASLHVHCIVFQLPPSTARAALIARLDHDPRVESAQPLNEFTTEANDRSDGSAEADPADPADPAGPADATDPAQTGPGAGTDPAPRGDRRAAWMPYNDPYAPLQWALRELDVVGAQRLSRGAGIRIAIIDTGVDLSHPDLRDRVAEYKNFVDRNAAQFSRDRHGTEVAGVIAAVANNGIGIVGVAPDARLLAFKACWQPEADAARAVCNSFTLAQGLEAALLAHADIVNLSLAGPPDPLLTRLVREGERQGMLFVGAVEPRDAPGGPAGSSAGFPTDIPGVLAVESAEDGPRRAGHLLAPGRDILTLAPGGHYDFASGSSLATAEVSGILALMIADGRRLASAAAEHILAESALADEPHAGPGAETRASPPLINACRALAEVAGRVGCEAGIRSVAGVKTHASAAR